MVAHSKCVQSQVRRLTGEGKKAAEIQRLINGVNGPEDLLSLSVIDLIGC
jgi:hypothetical protein